MIVLKFECMKILYMAQSLFKRNYLNSALFTWLSLYI
jgi:hypothetical protein